MPQGVRIAGRRYIPSQSDRAVATMLTAASWVLAQLPDRVVQDRRGELVRTLAEASDLVVEVAVGPVPRVRVRDGQRLLVEFPARQ